MTAGVEYREQGPIATITLSRPDRLNALTFDIYAELCELFSTIAKSSSIRAVIVTGTGRGFCSGGDVDEIIGRLVTREMPELLAFTRMTGALVRGIRACPKPVIAAINGIAAGAGAVIALACDFRIASENASLAFLFTKVGLAGADMGAAYLLPRIIGLGRATELLLLGDVVPAEAAQRVGLVTSVVAPDILMTETERLARRLAEGPSFALGMTKQLLNAELDMDFAAAIEAEAEGQAICMKTRNFREFYDAFVGKRRPEFD